MQPPSWSNAGGEPRPEAGARHERTLEGVGSSAWFGAAGVMRPACCQPPAPRVLSHCWFDIRVESEEVPWVVLVLQSHQPLIVLAIRCLDPLGLLVAGHMVGIGGASRVRL